MLTASRHDLVNQEMHTLSCPSRCCSRSTPSGSALAALLKSGSDVWPEQQRLALEEQLEGVRT